MADEQECLSFPLGISRRFLGLFIVLAVTPIHLQALPCHPFLLKSRPVALNHCVKSRFQCAKSESSPKEAAPPELLRHQGWSGPENLRFCGTLRFYEAEQMVSHMVSWPTVEMLFLLPYGLPLLGNFFGSTLHFSSLRACLSFGSGQTDHHCTHRVPRYNSMEVGVTSVPSLHVFNDTKWWTMSALFIDMPSDPPKKCMMHSGSCTNVQSMDDGHPMSIEPLISRVVWQLGSWGQKEFMVMNLNSLWEHGASV